MIKNVKEKMKIVKKLNNGQQILQSVYFNKYNIWDTWIISDTHFNHYPKTWDWPGRNEGWEQYMIDKWNTNIKINDVVLHLGDFGFGDKGKVFRTRKQLNGNIFLIKGNHDKHGGAWYEDIDITLIKKSFFIDTAGESYIFSHRPIKDDIIGYINIHGHIHEKYYFIKENFVNMSVEQTDFTPIKFIDLIRKYRLHS